MRNKTCLYMGCDNPSVIGLNGSCFCLGCFENELQHMARCLHEAVDNAFDDIEVYNADA